MTGLPCHRPTSIIPRPTDFCPPSHSSLLLLVRFRHYLSDYGVSGSSELEILTKTNMIDLTQLSQIPISSITLLDREAGTGASKEVSVNPPHQCQIQALL